MQDEETKEVFDLQEKRLLILYIFITILVVARHLAFPFGLITLGSYTDYISGLILSFILLFGLSYSYFSLIGLIKEYHPDKIVKIGRTLKYFFILEVFGLLSECMFDTFFILNKVFNIFGIDS